MQPSFVTLYSDYATTGSVIIHVVSDTALQPSRNAKWNISNNTFYINAPQEKNVFEASPFFIVKSYVIGKK